MVNHIVLLNKKYAALWLTILCFLTRNSVPTVNQVNYRTCSRNLRTFFSILAAEKSGCVKYADIFFVEVCIWVLFWYN